MEVRVEGREKSDGDVQVNLVLKVEMESTSWTSRRASDD
jgi:hypothetical protein